MFLRNLFKPFFLFAADDTSLGGGAPNVTATPSAPTTPEPQPAPAPAAPEASSATPTGQDQWQGIRDVVKAEYGMDLGQRFQDDRAALGFLVNGASQWSRLAPQWQELQTQLPEFRKWQAEQQKAAQPQPKGWEWKSPNYDPAWENQLVRDHLGQLVPAPGAPPDLAQRYYAGKKEFTDALMGIVKNPLEAIKPGLEQLIEQKAQALIQQHLGGYQEQASAQQIIQQNTNWIWQHQNGQQVIDPMTNQPVMTPAGRVYAGAIQKAHKLGIRGPQDQHEYAVAILGGAFAQQQQVQAQTPEQKSEQIKQNFLTQNNVTTNGGPATPPSQNASEPPVKGANALAREMMRNLEQSGIPANARMAG